LRLRPLSFFCYYKPLSTNPLVLSNLSGIFAPSYSQRRDCHGARKRGLSDNSGGTPSAFQQTLDLSDRIGSIFRSGLQNSDAEVRNNQARMQHRRDCQTYEFVVEVNPYAGVPRPVEDAAIKTILIMDKF